MDVFVDGERVSRQKLSVGTHEYTVATDLDNAPHIIRIAKATEASSGYWRVDSLDADRFFVVPEKSDLKIAFIGDSITAGYGALGTTDEGYTVDNSDGTRTYAYVAAQELGAEYDIVAHSGICVEAYQYSSLNMATLYNQYSYWNTQSYTVTFDADVVVLNLGTNDASYMLEHKDYIEQFAVDYQEFLTDLRTKYPNAYIICLYGMMRQDVDTIGGIKKAVSAMKDSKIIYNPFVITSNFGGGGNHPTAEAQETWGKALATYIQGLQF
jgi:lysophospholipase L1-like esterase